MGWWDLDQYVRDAVEGHLAECERNRLAHLAATPRRPLRTRLAVGLRALAAWLDPGPESQRSRAAPVR